MTMENYRTGGTPWFVAIDPDRVVRQDGHSRKPHGLVRETERAASIGQFTDFVLVFIGLFHNPILVFMAVFVYLAAASEAHSVALCAAVASKAGQIAPNCC